MVSPVHFSSKSEEWSTPQDLFDELHAEFGFVLDAAASNDNAKCRDYYIKADNALERDWAEDLGRLFSPGGPVFVNPPYGRGVTGKWIAKCAEEQAKGVTVVALLPARTDVRAWHQHILGPGGVGTHQGVEVRFVKGRLKFGNASNPAPFPSAIVVFRGV